MVNLSQLGSVIVLADRLAELLDGPQKVMSATELAEKMEVTGATISRWKTGEREPRASDVARMAVFLKTTPSYLLGTEECSCQPMTFIIRVDRKSVV